MRRDTRDQRIMWLLPRLGHFTLRRILATVSLWGRADRRRLPAQQSIEIMRFGSEGLLKITNGFGIMGHVIGQGIHTRYDNFGGCIREGARAFLLEMQPGPLARTTQMLLSRAFKRPLRCSPQNGESRNVSRQGMGPTESSGMVSERRLRSGTALQNMGSGRPKALRNGWRSK